MDKPRRHQNLLRASGRAPSGLSWCLLELLGTYWALLRSSEGLSCLRLEAILDHLDGFAGLL
eukprot:1815130-Pyramimonas_sp.AAC.1